MLKSCRIKSKEFEESLKIIQMNKIPSNFKCRQAIQKSHLDTVEILFLLPPNIEFEDFVSPPANISTIQKGEKQFGSVITDPPLGVISLSAYVKKFLPVNSRCIDFNTKESTLIALVSFG